MRVSEHVSEEGAIRVRVTAEHDDVAANDHVPTLRGEKTRRCSDTPRAPALLRCAMTRCTAWRGWA
jgi:hypothetical protein